jgi:hypothetical protein
MRPHLHPEMGQVVICARVAVQLVAIEYRHRPNSTRSPGQISRFLLANLPPDYPGMLRLALHSLGSYLDIDWKGQEWLSSVLEAAHFGNSFRRCFFFDYKENRRPYPRVTNRGVQTSSNRRELLDKEA